VPKSDRDNTWLQPVLRQGLKRVTAPGELWNRIAMPPVDDRRAQPKRTFTWMLACASAAAASVLALAWGHYPGARFDFRSNNASEVRSWIHDRTGLDIPLATPSHPKVEMIGASVVQTGAVEIRYRAENQEVLLVVSRAGAALPEHEHLDMREIRYATSISWAAGRQAYTVSVQRAGDLRLACLGCHSESTI